LNQNRAVSTVTALWVGQPGVRFLAGVADIRSKTHRPVSSFNPVSCSVDTGVRSPVVKAATARSWSLDSI